MLARHWVARISILTLAHVVGTVPIVSVMAMAPVIQSDLGLSVTEVGLLVSGYYLAQTIGAVPAGGLVDRIGVGRALLTSHVLLIAGALTFSQAESFAGAVTPRSSWVSVTPSSIRLPPQHIDLVLRPPPRHRHGCQADRRAHGRCACGG